MCTLEQRGNIFLLTLTGDGEHRLNLPLISTLLSKLREIKAKATRGSVLITTSEGKFFSNGFDLAWAKSAGGNAMDRLHEMVESFRPVAAEMLSLPMPTIAAVNGHAAAAGFLFALCHDYFLMRGDKGVLYMSEIDLGLPLPDYFAAVFRSKIGGVPARRDVLLRGSKVRGEEAVKLGIVDSAHDSEEGLADAAVRLGEQLAARKWDGGNYGEVRKCLYPDACGVLGLATGEVVAKL